MKSLYIHIPFCEHKCFYCSFVVSVGQRQRIDAYLDALAKEACSYQGEMIQTIYIGGGTPTFLNEAQLDRLISMLHCLFRFDPDVEFTIEANPEGLDRFKLQILKQAGVNRLSLGVQSLNDQYLKYLGRNHDSERVYAAFSNIKQAGFENVSLDLMYGFPGQTISELEQDVEQIVRLGSEHLSLYMLTIEENSRFYAQKIVLPKGKEQAKQYELVCEWLEMAGFQQYEVSNFARNGRPSKHNLNYWTGGEYIGLGIGAHSHIAGKRFWNVPRLTDYIERLKKNQSVIEGSEQLSREKQFLETFLFGLRMNQGVHLGDLQKRFQNRLDSQRLESIQNFVREGYFERNENIVRATPKGRLVLDEICARLI